MDNVGDIKVVITSQLKE